MSDAVELALVGCGRAAERLHGPVLRGLPGVRLAALVDPRVERCELLAARIPGCRAYASVREMLEGARVAAAVVASPPASHADAARELLEAGVWVLLEKPLALDAEGARRIARAEAGSRAALMMGFNRRHLGAVARLRAVFAARPPGPDLRADLALATDPGGWSSVEPTPDPLVDLAPHPFDLLRHLLDREIAAVSATRAGRTLRAELELEGGIRARCRVAHEGTPVERARFEAKHDRYAIRVGSERIQPADGALRFALDARDALTRRLRRRTSPWLRSFEVQLARFLDCVRRGGPPQPGVRDGVAALLAVEAARRSADAGGERIAVETAP